ncbi:hypothetical protein SODALDRAFT_324140 [Sodiomyces alkalinus F11]|uniref:Secreted protein n=1 Tax=Sodiomyces alkalinus (strain CBS 110278 / VKM F-3762 / F11) TaxID=1314773 RepID=A0A3N2PWJ6_SODAK|nr:hypothetical protein SODALDRAFT_324140 [Sodiomyces alkalinus F11]ROT38715.1 hypothetical protein SODALDRAFT_324140 [Sodiomyces alkalinus F11]
MWPASKLEPFNDSCSLLLLVVELVCLQGLGIRSAPERKPKEIPTTMVRHTTRLEFPCILGDASLSWDGLCRSHFSNLMNSNADHYGAFDQSLCVDPLHSVSLPRIFLGPPDHDMKSRLAGGPSFPNSGAVASSHRHTKDGCGS